jgi:hypothetical protein
VVGDSGKSDKTMALIIQALGVQDQRESNKFRDFSEMARLVSDLSDGKGGGGIVSDIAEGLGQVAQGITGAIMAAKQAPPPQHVFVQPPQPPLLPGQVSPPPGVAIQAMPGVAQPALPAPRQVVSIPQAPVAQEQPSGGEDEVTDEDLKSLAAHVLSLALQECDAKPAQAAWVKAIFDGLPNEWVEMVAEAKNYTELADLVKPYATSSMDRLVPLILKIKGDPGVRPWLEAGFVQLQAMCRRERGAPAPPPAAAAEPAPPAAAAPEETEPAEDGGGGEFGEET